MSAGYGNDNDNDGNDKDVDSTDNDLKDLFNFTFLKWGPRAENRGPRNKEPRAEEEQDPLLSPFFYSFL